MSSQQGPKAAPGQHSAHILLGIILREPQSTSANFLGNVGEGEGALGDGLVHASNLLRTTLMIYKSAEVAVPQVQYNTRRVRLLEAIKP